LQVRHAQGIHNVAGEKDFKAYMSHDLFDAQLTPLGWSQVDGLREHVKKSGLAKKIELVITSPLLRTMQTAVGVFGGENYTDGVSAAPLMVENAGHSGRPAVSSLNCPPFLAVETCREHLGVHPCDKRRSITEYRPLFPAIDFSLIENDEDVLWEPDVREANESVALRGMKFIDWLWTREEKEIAIVSHSGFLYHTLSMYSKECHPTIRDEVGKHFANCELRSMVLVDRRCVFPPQSWTLRGLLLFGACFGSIIFCICCNSNYIFHDAACLGRIPRVSTTLGRFQPDSICLVTLQIRSV
jgi:broad specificity phosphatase PhoE